MGCVAWGLQLLIYSWLDSAGLVSYAAATALAYLPLVAMNCTIQRYLIFKSQVSFHRFLASNIASMLLATLIAPGLKRIIDLVIGSPYGDRFGFAVAAVFVSVPTYLLNKYWVFNETPDCHESCHR